MRIKWTPISAVAALAVVAAAALSCGKHPTAPSQPPPPPPPPPTVQLARLELNAPASIAPGTSVPLTVTGIRSDGTTDNVTASAQWSSSDPRVVAVDASGVARAVSLGDATISARIQRLQAASQVVVVPAGTYRLTGKISDSGLGLAGVTVTVISGVGEGLVVTSDAVGAYALYGVRGQIVLQAKRDGYLNSIEGLDVNDNRVYDFGMRLDHERTDLRGRYALTFTRMSCGADVPQARTYDATIEQDGPRLKITLSGADFIVTGGRGNSFAGLVDGDRVQFSLSAGSYNYYYYYYSGHYDLVERLDPSHAFIIAGAASGTRTAAGIAGSLNGSFFVANVAPFGYVLGRCEGGSHRFEMTRR